MGKLKIIIYKKQIILNNMKSIYKRQKIIFGFKK